mmetsp:Transcript_28911/g.66383  ORF Transcript_28911/g.66383 Transcript_28911/m.66383 type:complete len:538 (+) Transcript_28911:472-2085(+)
MARPRACAWILRARPDLGRCPTPAWPPCGSTSYTRRTPCSCMPSPLCWRGWASTRAWRLRRRSAKYLAAVPSPRAWSRSRTPTVATSLGIGPASSATAGPYLSASSLGRACRQLDYRSRLHSKAQAPRPSRAAATGAPRSGISCASWLRIRRSSPWVSRACARWHSSQVSNRKMQSGETGGTRDGQSVWLRACSCVSLPLSCALARCSSRRAHRDRWASSSSCVRRCMPSLPWKQLQMRAPVRSISSTSRTSCRKIAFSSGGGACHALPRSTLVDLPPPSPGGSRLEALRCLLERLAKRLGALIAAWTAVGFVHGVMNTDNLSLIGLTIDMNVYGFVDEYDPAWSPNHIDTEARYAFGEQRAMARWGLEQLIRAVSGLAFTADNQPDTRTWQAAHAEPADGEAAWLPPEYGKEAPRLFEESFENCHDVRMRLRLGLSTSEGVPESAPGAPSELVKSWTAWLGRSRAVYPTASRALAEVHVAFYSERGDDVETRLTRSAEELSRASGARVSETGALCAWLGAYREQVLAEARTVGKGN